MRLTHSAKLACGLISVAGLLGTALPAAGASVTPRGASTRDAFEVLAEKGLRVVQLGRERDLLVPAELRFKPSDGRALIEAVAKISGRKVVWTDGGRTAVMLRDAPEAEVAAALKAMQAADAPARAAAAKRAGELDDQRVIEPLLAAVADADLNVAREAMGALAHLGWPAVSGLAPTEKVLEALARGLERKDPGLVRSAASVLPEIGDEKVLGLVEKTLGYGEAVWSDNQAAFVRRHAAFALGTIGGEKALRLVEKAVGDKHPWVAEIAPLGLVGLDVGRENVRGVVEKALSDPREGVRSATASALRASGEKALPLLEKALTDRSSYVRVRAVLAAGQIGGDKALALVEKALWGRSDGHAYHGSSGLGINAVRGTAAFALGYVGGEKTLPNIEKALQDGSYTVRRGAVWSLGRVGGAGAVAVAGRALDHKDSIIRECAVWALGAIGDERGLPLVEKALADADALVRWDAAAVLGEIGGERALALAGRALESKDPDLRGSAALALGEIGGEKALALIEKVIGDDDLAVRRDATAAAGRAGVARARDLLTRRLGAEPEPEIRSAVLASLQQYFPDDPAAIKASPTDPGWTDPAKAGTEAASASGPLPAEMELAGKGGTPTLVRTTVGDATGRRILSSWESFFQDRGLAVEAVPADQKPVKPATAAMLAFETESSAPTAAAAGIDLGPLKNAREEAYLLVARKHDGRPLVTVIGKTARGTDAGAAWLFSKVGWDGNRLTVPPLQEFRAPFFRVREGCIGANGRELAGRPAWARRDNYECWDESEIRQYPPYLRACGFNALQLAECDTYRNGGRGRGEDVRRPVATLADAGRDAGLAVKFYIFGSSDGWTWADPITQPLKKTRYRELARRYGRFADVINAHWMDDGDENGYQTPLEGSTFLWREFRKRNPAAEAVCDAWCNDFLFLGIADERWAPKDVGIALMQWYRPDQARQVLAAGRRCGIWGWYISDYEMTFGSHLVGRHMDEKYYGKLPEAASRETEWLCTELTHHRLPSEIDLYLSAQKMWNPKRPMAGIMLDYCRAVYGPANAAAMRLVYETVEAGQGPYIHQGEYNYPKVLGTPEFTAKAKQALAALDGVKLPAGWRPNFAPMATPAEHIASLRKSLEAHIQGKPHDWAAELRGPPPAR
jgi:HEAT repeat protein